MLKINHLNEGFPSTASDPYFSVVSWSFVDLSPDRIYPKLDRAVINEPWKSVHITLQLRRDTFFCLILLFVAFYSTAVPLTFSKVVLLVSKFLTCTIKRVKIGKKKTEVISQNKNRPNKQYFSRSFIYS